MKHVFLMVALFLLGASCSWLGCQEAANDSLLGEEPPTAAVQEETQPPELIATKPTLEDTFARLRKAFPNTMVDGDFTALQRVTRSRLYQDFLAREYPTEPTVETLEAYYQRVPDAARYRQFLQPWIPQPLETDIEVFHQLVLQTQEIEIVLFQSLHRPDPNPLAILGQVLDAKGWDNEAVEAWFARHNNIVQDSAFMDALLLFAKESLHADATWLHELFEAHGTDDGLLWCALRRPALTGKILTHFSDTALFLTWVEEKSGETEK